ncbi:uncharacterized protein EAE98_011848 [Botrytis deweyae]|uniref:Piwi domain-containing protein n=1 Tax=Botrytis deweyae TaxID=2478750 RepID=A0ABQ7I4X7_9HELO|nr:uncharacterized protein EAE98_011848 [Botrytis deweyae]KAF7911733.1 hypothetical protein EAE98_011848 [Botrytis deweyae]
MQQYVRNCALCNGGKSEHQRTEHCLLDPDINPYRRFDAERQCDFCKRDHEPHQCKEAKANACGNCGHGWHDKRECMLDQSFDSHLEQFTLPKYKTASQIQKARPESRREECRDNYNKKFKKGRYAQSLPSATLTSTPSESGPSETGTSVSRSIESHPLAPSLSAPGPVASGSTISLSEANASLPSQSSHPRQKSQASGQTQSQTQVQAPAGGSDDAETGEKDEATIRKENREKWTSASLELPGYPPENQIPPISNNNPNAKTNFFQVSINPNPVDLRRYRIEFGKTPSYDSAGKITHRNVFKPDVKRTTIDQMLTANPPTATVYATDYFCYIISVGRLYHECGDDLNNIINKSHSIASADSTLPDLTMTNGIVYESNVNLAELQRFVNRDPARNPNYNPGEDLKSLNIISWQRIHLSTFQGGRLGNKFYPDSMGNHNVDVVPPGFSPESQKYPLWNLRSGFFSSMRPGSGCLLLNVNCTTSAFFPDIILENWIYAKFGNGIQPTDVLRMLRGVKVTFIGDSKRKKRAICGIDPLTVSQKMFTPTGGNPISVWQHMSNTYPKHQQDCSQNAWCVNVGSSINGGMKIWYPADMLRICLWQPAGKKAGVEITQQMLTQATKTPYENQRALMVDSKPHLALVPPPECYVPFGIRVSPDLLLLSRVRQLAPPELRFRNPNPNNQDRVRGVYPNLATWALTKVAIKRPQDTLKGFDVVSNVYPKLFVINLTQHRNAVTFIETLMGQLRNYGFSAQTYSMAPAIIDAGLNAMTSQLRRASVTTILNAVVTRWEQQFNLTGIPLIIVLLPNSKKSNPRLYSDVKWWGDCVRGIPTVCISEDAIRKGAKKQGGDIKIDFNLMANIALKINFKLGGRSHHVQDLGVENGTMIMGADVTHVGKGQDDGCPSQAGVVATRDQHHIHYLASARLQTHNTEFIEDLEGMVEERLEAYYQRNRRLPKHILFYRDGVGETQYGMVLREELPQVRVACMRMATKYDGNSPLITLLVVGKRHHARFFPEIPLNAPANGRNLIAGTVVDRNVNDPNRTNFYLQSHDSALGTARTGHYVVIVDESAYGLDRLERVTNNICYTGSRATKGLSVCTPAKYADILCTRLRCYMYPALHREMGTTLTNATVTQYRQNATIWNSTAGNPWHPNVKNIMFYL